MMKYPETLTWNQYRSFVTRRFRKRAGFNKRDVPFVVTDTRGTPWSTITVVEDTNPYIDQDELDVRIQEDTDESIVTFDMTGVERQQAVDENTDRDDMTGGNPYGH